MNNLLGIIDIIELDNGPILKESIKSKETPKDAFDDIKEEKTKKK